MKLLSKKLNVVIIAGASGIGREIAIAYHQENCRVFVCDISDDFIEKFKNDYPSIFVKKTDVSLYDNVSTFFKEIKVEEDRIDVLVNCAGIAGPTASLEDIDPDEWDHTIKVNLNGMFYCLREAIPLLKKLESPSIINIASSASFYWFPLRSPYTPAKWAVIWMTKTLAMELGSDGVRVNAICPGSVRGERINTVIEADALKQGKTIEEIEKLYLSQVSLKKFVEPEDVANLALFLSSDLGRFISGQAIGLDGHTEGLSNNL